MSLKLITQQTATEATDSKGALQAAYDAAEISDVLVAKSFQINAWSSMGIPFARSAEFDALSMEDKTKWGLISIYASSSTYQGLDLDYSAAWESEYTKMYP